MSGEAVLSSKQGSSIKSASDSGILKSSASSASVSASASAPAIESESTSASTSASASASTKARNFNAVMNRPKNAVLVKAGDDPQQAPEQQQSDENPTSAGKGNYYKKRGHSANSSSKTTAKERTRRLIAIFARKNSSGGGGGGGGYSSSDSEDDQRVDPSTRQRLLQGTGNNASRLLSTYAAGPLSDAARKLNKELTEEHRFSVYMKSVEIVAGLHNRWMQRVEAKDRYCEFWKKEMEVGPKREALRQRQCRWLTIIFSVAPVYVLTAMARKLIAVEVLKVLFFPVWICKFRTRKVAQVRRELALDLARKMKRPAAENLASHKFFAKFPKRCLATLIQKMEPKFCRANECVMHEGDFGNEMFYIESGSVCVFMRRHDSRSKRRAKENGIVVATLQSGTYFGEFALLTDEPRAATVQCLEDTFMWAIERTTFRQELESIADGSPVQQILMEIADQRRLQNMKKLYPLRNTHLKSLEIFLNWPDEKLAQLVERFTPYVAHTGEVVIHEGDFGTCMYIVGQGRVKIFKRHFPELSALSPSDEPPPPDSAQGLLDLINEVNLLNQPASTQKAKVAEEEHPELGKLQAVLGKGSFFGEVACLFLEPRCASALCVTNCDLWRLTKSDLMDFMLSNVNHLLQAREITNHRRSKWISRFPASHVALCPFLREIYGEKLGRVADAVARLLKPRVVSQSETVLERGSVEKKIIFVLSGEVRSEDGVVGPGQSIVSSALAHNRPSPHEYRALSRCEMWFIQEAGGLALVFDKFPPLRTKIQQLSARQHRRGPQQQQQQQLGFELGSERNDEFTDRSRPNVINLAKRPAAAASASTTSGDSSQALGSRSSHHAAAKRPSSNPPAKR